MVLSKINEAVSYPEIKTIDENDKGRDVSMFKIVLHNMPVVIALGDVKYTFIKNKILFCPVYLVVDESDKIYQIGVYEFKSTEYENLLDEDNDLDISLISGPLLYSFFDKAYLKQCMKDEVLVSDDDSGDETSVEDDNEMEDLSDLEKEVENDDRENDEDEPLGERKSGMNPPPVLVELDIEKDRERYIDDDDFLRKGETDKDDKKERKQFKKPKKSDSQWIEQFMHNNNYNIIDNAGGGDCLFYTVRDAYRTIEVDANVDLLRNKLADVVDQGVFDNYKEFFDSYEQEFKNLKKKDPKLKQQLKKLKDDYNKKAKSAKAEKDRQRQKKMIKEAKDLKQDYKEKRDEITQLKKELAQVMVYKNSWRWMKNVKNVDDLKAKIKTCDFWADVWAISTLEMVLNTKLIILSSDFYNKGKYNKVLRCGDMVPTEIEEKNYFKPKYYIMVEHTGNHYKLITYKERQIFRFHQIPYGIKRLIVDTCMKSRTGKSLYNYIPKFAKLIGQTIIVPTEVSKKTALDLSKKVDDDEKIDSEKSEEDEDEVEMMPTPTPEDGDLFTDDVVFMFYSKSADKKPGKGNGETISAEKMLEFNELAKMKNWRKTLSNFYTKPKRDGEVQPLFELDGLKWASVEHYYHANKFKKNNPDYYRLFSIDSGSQIMDDPKKALGAGGKTGKVAGKKFRPKEVVMDEDFFDNKNNERIMEKGQQAKYEQDETARAVLLATKDAKLLHYVASRKPKDQRPPPVVFYDTMRIRDRLKKKN